MNAPARRDYRALIGLCIASALATIPVWIPHYPMMVDVPQHASQIALLANLGGSGFRFSNLFEHHWFTPYWFGYLLAYLLRPVTGIVVAIKMVVSLALFSFPISTAFLIDALGVDPWWAWLCIPAMYGFACQWGFLNFLVAVPVGLVFLGLVVRYAKADSTTSPWLIGAFAVALLFCHALICLLFGLVGALYLWFEGSDWQTAIRKIKPLLAPVPLICYYVFRVPKTPVPVTMDTSWNLGWFSTTDPYYSVMAPFGDGVHGGWGRINGFFPRLLGLRPGLSCIIAGAILFALPWLSGAKLSRRIGIWVPLAVLSVFLLLMPDVLLANAYTYQRLTLFAPAFFAIIWVPQDRADSRQRLARVCTVLLAVALIGIFVQQGRAFNAEQAGFSKILNDMAPGERVLSLVLDRDSNVGIAPLFLHFPAWYTAERGGLSDPSFAAFGISPVRFRLGSAPPTSVGGFEWFPNSFKWGPDRGMQYRYFVARFGTDVGPFLFRTATCPVRLVDHAGEWWLYEADSKCGSTTAKLRE